MASERARTCLGCRNRGPQSDLIRVVLAVEPFRLVVDKRARLGGRGAYVHPDSRCVSRAIALKAFVRALRADGPVDTGALEEWLAELAGHDHVEQRGEP